MTAKADTARLRAIAYRLRIDDHILVLEFVRSVERITRNRHLTNRGIGVHDFTQDIVSIAKAINECVKQDEEDEDAEG